jgi:YYY domain-containing protein
MIELFEMWALVEVVGLVCLPLTVTVFHNLPDRGWAFSKALGMAVFAFCVWLPLMCVHSLPFSRIFIASVGLVLLLLAFVGFVRVRHAVAKFVRLNVAYVLVTEVVFLGMVFLLGWLRSFGPAINSYEMFMDEGFIASIMRSPHFPPTDMWFAGYSINYYYYAHYSLAMLAKLLGQSPSIAFNTGICVFFGLTAANLFGVACNIVAWARHLRLCKQAGGQPEGERPDTIHPSLGRAIPYGLLTFIMGEILGNLAATQQWWAAHGDWASYDWWAPSRVIDNTINEFPAFSFLLSCFHAHVLTLAFTIMAIGMAFNLFLEPGGQGFFVFGRGWCLFLTLAATALVIGGLFVMNGWDYPTYMGLALVCIGLQQWLTYGRRLSMALALDIFSAGGALIALSFLLFIPFYLNFISPSQGLGLVAAADRTPLYDEFLIYGLYIFLFLSLLLVSAAKTPLFELSFLPEEDGAGPLRSRRVWMWILLGVLVALLLTLVLMRNGATFVFATSITILGVVLLFYNSGDRAHAFTLLLGSTAFALIAGCEIFFLRDVFAGNFPRMNTVFKFYFQAWALLSITSAVGLFFILEGFLPARLTAVQQRWLRQGIGAAWGAALLVLLLASMAYPLSAPEARYARVNPVTGAHYLQRSNNLDGLTYLKTDPAEPGDYDAIRWLNAHVQGNPVIVEAIGNDYSLYGRVSAFTGLPTIMGWEGHEYQWRVNWLNNTTNAINFNQRAADVDLIYTSPDPRVVLSVMARYHARYLYVGALEYAKYPKANLHRFSTFMQVVYNAEGVTIYQVR